MNPYQKGAQLLIRLVAAGLVLIGGMLAGLEFLSHRARHVELNVFKMAGYALMFFAGVVLLIASSKLAARLTDESPEDDNEETPDE
jgi:hypothetical protein